MSSAIGSGAIIFPSQSRSQVGEFASNLLGKISRDDLWTDCYSRPINADSTLSMVNFNDFKLAALQDGMYDLSEIVMQLNVTLMDESGAEIAVNAEVAPRCGILHNLISQVSVICHCNVFFRRALTLFSPLQILINDVVVTKFPQFYPFKAFLHNMLHYDTGTSLYKLQNEKLRVKSFKHRNLFVQFHTHLH